MPDVQTVMDLFDPNMDLFVECVLVPGTERVCS